MAGAEFSYIPQLGGHLAHHDPDMETTIPGLYVAGDVAGVEEASTAIEEGRLAGVAAAESLGKLGALEAKARKEAIWQRLNDLRAGPFGEGRLGCRHGRVHLGLATGRNFGQHALRGGIDGLEVVAAGNGFAVDEVINFHSCLHLSGGRWSPI